jgi:hypothetical protein
MEKTTAQLTAEYIKEHPYIKTCLKKGLINYSSLSRLIAKDLGIEKKTSKEAILIAARRFREKLKEEASYEKKTKDLLARSEMDIKNKMTVFVLEKSIDMDSVDEIQKVVRKEAGTFYIVEGYGNYTIITQEKYVDLIKDRIRPKIIRHKRDMVLITMKSPEDIEEAIGVVYYTTSLFAENGINIVEFLSCWTDTLFVIKADDLGKAMNFLKF